MLNISGIGFAVPDNKISNQLIAELNPNFMLSHFEKDSGVVSRYSALNPGYLRETKNSNIEQSFANLDQTDLELAERAVAQALRRSGVELSDIGLVIGETSTPFQTIPSQGQRVAGKLGLKVKAYDILAGAASPSLHFSTLASWRTERLPDYVLLVYSNLPTVFIDYAVATPSMARLSDAAAAVVLSTRRKASLKLIAAESRSDVSMASSEIIDIAGPLRISSHLESVSESQIEVLGARILKEIPRGPKKNYFVPTQISPRSVKRLGEILGFAGDEVLISQYGDSFSSGVYGPISDIWEHLSSGDRIYMIVCGIGLQSGYVVMEVN